MSDELILEIILRLIEKERICSHLENDGEQSRCLLTRRASVDSDEVAAITWPITHRDEVLRKPQQDVGDQVESVRTVKA